MVARTASVHRLRARPPFRLDLTVQVLRRLPSNRVDLLTSEGEYLRAFRHPHGISIARVHQTAEGIRVRVEVQGSAPAGKGDAEVVASLRRILGLQRDLTPFRTAAEQISWLEPLVRRMAGVKPPRYPTFWEAFINSIVFQQVSLEAATTIVQRLIAAVGEPVRVGEVELYPFPDHERVLSAEHSLLRSVGLSESKLAALRRAGEALASGAISEEQIEERTSPEASRLLQTIKGIGPWTAAVILLRGFGRLDVFPMNDTGVARNLARLTGGKVIDVPQLIARLEPYQGMLYYQLLLSRTQGGPEAGA